MARYHLALINVDGIGPMTAARLLAAFPNVERAFGASVTELRSLGLTERQAISLASFKDFSIVDRILEEASRLGQTVVALNDVMYPPALRTIEAPPPVLFLRGALSDGHALSVTVVGTRQPTLYGEKVATRLGAALARSGLCTVSGGARGIDAAAHRGALAENGKTIAVLGTGLDVPYPPEHVGLFEQIAASGGVLLSELPPGTPPTRGAFPVRNRLLVALGRACVIVEAGERSGALISARYAAEQGKTVIAVPGPIDRAESRGTNRLIRDGAKPLLEIGDVVEEVLGEHLRRGRAEDENFIGRRTAAAPQPPPPGDAGMVLDALVLESADTDTLVQRTGLSAARVNAALVELEILGRVERRPGNIYLARMED